jgi:hypothetical protein
MLEVTTQACEEILGLDFAVVYKNSDQFRWFLLNMKKCYCCGFLGLSNFLSIFFCKNTKFMQLLRHFLTNLFTII